jgi:hypothetical protein
MRSIEQSLEFPLEPDALGHLLYFMWMLSKLRVSSTTGTDAYLSRGII